MIKLTNESTPQQALQNAILAAENAFSHAERVSTSSRVPQPTSWSHVAQAWARVGDLMDVLGMGQPITKAPEDDDENPKVSINLTEHHDEDTLVKVRAAIASVEIYDDPLTTRQVTDIILAIQNAGILFRERAVEVTASAAVRRKPMAPPIRRHQDGESMPPGNISPRQPMLTVGEVETIDAIRAGKLRTVLARP